MPIYDDRLEVIKKVLKRPYHFFTLGPSAKNTRLKLLILETAFTGKGFHEISFSGNTRFECIRNGEEYVQQMRDTGNLPPEKDETETEPEKTTET